ncbi:Vacuolar protein sorting-associated protein 13D, partial [Ophiophagus hannah]
SGDALDREAIFLEVKYDDLYHCLISRDHGQVYVQLTKKAVNSTSGISMPGPSHQKPMGSVCGLFRPMAGNPQLNDRRRMPERLCRTTEGAERGRGTF